MKQDRIARKVTALAVAAAALPVAALAACSSPAALSDRDWQPRVIPSDCEVRIEHRDDRDFETVQYHDAQGRLISGTAQPVRDGEAWERFAYDARGRLVAITSHEDRPSIDGNCDVVGGCDTPALRAIERIELAWDDAGRLLRKRYQRDEYEDRGGRYRPSDSASKVREYGGGAAADSAGQVRGTTHAFQRDDRGRVVRRDTLRKSELEHFETWEYDDRGAVSRYVDTWVHASGGPRHERELRLRYDDAGRLREVVADGKPQRIYTYTGRCDAVRIGPAPPGPMTVEQCITSPHRVLDPCWW